MPKVSIIVPVYKVENYLEPCINSILAQDYSDWELILVDDGSPDRCGKICDDYASQDARVQVVHKENGGPSSARNVGIQMARGTYVLFVDADDRLSSKAVSVLVDKAEEGYDLVCAAYTDISEYGETVCNDFAAVTPDRSCLVNCVISGTGGVLWGKIFNLDIIRKNNIVLNEAVYMSEDMLFVLEYIRYCTNWSAVGEPIYFYNRMNQNSQSAMVSAKYLASFEHFFNCLRVQLRTLNISEEIIEMYIENRAISVLRRIFSSNQFIEESFETVSSSDLFSRYLSVGAQKTKTLSLVKDQHWNILRISNRMIALYRKCKKRLHRRKSS